MSDLAVTWWGHSSATVELGGVRVAVDPLLTDRLAHLRRRGSSPDPSAARADVVLVSHQHADHLHVPSLRRFGPGTVLVGPRGAEHLLDRCGTREVRTVAPGDEVEVRDVRIRVLAASHPGHRHPLARGGVAVGFRVEAGGRSCWYPGDTGLRDDLADVDRVDLGLVPIGGWGPTLPPSHLSPETGAEAVRRVGATYAVPVHWGTFWPVGLDRLAPGNHQRLFVSPGSRFAAALGFQGDPEAIVAAHGERVVLR